MQHLRGQPQLDGSHNQSDNQLFPFPVVGETGQMEVGGTPPPSIFEVMVILRLSLFTCTCTPAFCALSNFWFARFRKGLTLKPQDKFQTVPSLLCLFVGQAQTIPNVCSHHNFSKTQFYESVRHVPHVERLGPYVQLDFLMRFNISEPHTSETCTVRIPTYIEPYHVQ